MSAKLKKQIVSHLSEQPLSLQEIAEKMELKEKRTFKLLRSLFQKDQIVMVRGDDGIRRYKNNEEA